MNAKRLIKLSFYPSVIATALLVSSCGSSINNSASNNTVSKTWQVVKAGTFNDNDIFYAQFGAVPFEITANFDAKGQTAKIHPIQSGSILRYSIYDASKNTVTHTFVMEKLSSLEDPDKSWQYSATGASGEKMDVGDSCLSCHKQQASNDYLFSIPRKK